MRLTQGAILANRFRILHSLGEGGFASAYLVEDRRLHQQRVIKASLSHEVESSEAFEQEARILADLRHPNLPTIYDYLIENDLPYLVMEYIEGITLDRLANENSTPFALDQVLRWADQLLDALVYLHGRNPPIIHRDIKPSNVCLTPEGRVVLLDFGIARRLDETHTRPSARAYSFYYSPLEQYLADAEGQYPTLRQCRNDLVAANVHTGPYSDVYSLAATMYFCLTLRHPPNACLRVVEDALYPICDLNPDVPSAVSKALEYGLVVDPRRRCQTASELRWMLSRATGPDAWQIMLRFQRKEKRPMYTAEISRVNPTCFLFLIDQSWSMADPFGGSEVQASKAAMLADTINRLLDTLVGRCSKGEGVWRYFQVGVIGYGADVGPAFGGVLGGQDLVWIDDIANNPLRVEDRMRKIPDGAGGLVEMGIKFPVWFESVANNGTPMVRALWQAHTILENWVAQHPGAFPPVAINITDGESTDGNPLPPSEAVRELATEDGNVLLLNLHLSSHRAARIPFPDSSVELPDDYARLLFEMSSVLPDHMRQMALEKRYNVSAASRGFVFHADITDVVEFLDIGTRAANMR